MNFFTYGEITTGQTESFSVTITQEMMDSFLKITGDCSPIHSDVSYAQKYGYPDILVWGMLTASFFSTVSGLYLPGGHGMTQTVSAEFLKPVYPGDTLTFTAVVQKKEDAFRVIWIKILVKNQSGEQVCRGKLRAGVRM